MILGFVLVFYTDLPRSVFVCLTIFWRLAYDLGLGLLLRYQSEKRIITRWYERWNSDSSNWRYKFLRLMVPRRFKDGSEYKPESFPAEFNAWIVFKQLVTFILANDVAFYIVCGIKCFTRPSELTVWVAGQYLLGLVLIIFNYWAKVDAHRCIGEYCWYWGDFFYLKNQNLTFDGIFELFPHPMYSVGYSSYYGYSLICRSYTMLFVSVAAHMMQLAFLVLVEEPHIQKTYGSGTAVDKNSMRVLYDTKSGWFPDKKDNIFFLHLDVFRSGDFALLALAAYALTLSLVVPWRGWCVVQVVVWRLLHWLGVGAVLWHQSRREWWTRRFVSQGRTLYEAFAHWKRIYNLSSTMNVVVFVGCAYRYLEFEWADLLKGSFMACVVAGVLLILLSLWSSVSTYEAIGDFGWFYGDFFIKANAYKQHLCYTGIYRFVNNPECVTGYAGIYGAALITHSYTILALALFSHALNIAFLNIVEIPHMKKLYNDKIRQESPIPRVIKQKLPEIQRLEDSLKKQLRQVRVKAVAEMYDIYQKLRQQSRLLRRDRADQQASQPVAIRAPERISLGSSLTVEFETTADHSDLDWVGVYPPETASRPGASEGRWMYVCPGANGSIVFPPALLPSQVGVYELRYHLKNRYGVVASCPVIVDEPSESDQAEAEADAEQDLDNLAEEDMTER